MILYIPIMANTKSAKKNIRSSARKKKHNDMWEKKYKDAKKSLSKAISAKESLKIISDKFVALQKSLDKAAKEKVIHKNKANRVKSNYARKISALALQKEERIGTKSTEATGGTKPAKPGKASIKRTENKETGKPGKRK
jgi:small subunit ribosomal protein S20